jgi:hypothetical protein
MPLMVSQASLISPVLSLPTAMVPTLTIVANVFGLSSRERGKYTGAADDAHDHVGARHGCGLGGSGLRKPVCHVKLYRRVDSQWPAR